MTCYENGKIYIIRNNVNEMVYIGSTCNPLHKRFYAHKRDMKNKCNMHKPLYKDMALIGVDNYYIELIEEFRCENKMQLNKREGEVMRT